MQLNKCELRQTKPSRENYVNLPRAPIVLLLDNIQSSFNIGSFIRLADAFAIEKIIICGDVTITPKKLSKSSRNVDKWVCIEYSNNISNSLNDLRERDYDIFSIELCDESIDFRSVTYNKPCAFVLGNERNGVSADALINSHQQIHIPMSGMGNSMNVSTAGAIVLAECMRQKLINNALV